MNQFLQDANKILKELRTRRPKYKVVIGATDNMLRSINQVDIKNMSNLEYVITVKSRLEDVHFDFRSLKKSIRLTNDGILDFGNIDTYDDYAIEDIFKNIHILINNLQNTNKTSNISDQHINHSKLSKHLNDND